LAARVRRRVQREESRHTRWPGDTPRSQPGRVRLWQPDAASAESGATSLRAAPAEAGDASGVSAKRLLGALGGGLIAGASDTDPTTVATLPVGGATTIVWTELAGPAHPADAARRPGRQRPGWPGQPAVADVCWLMAAHRPRGRCRPSTGDGVVDQLFRQRAQQALHVGGRVVALDRDAQQPAALPLGDRHLDPVAVVEPRLERAPVLDRQRH